MTRHKLPLARYNVVKVKHGKQYHTQICVAKAIVRGKNPLEVKEGYTWGWMHCDGTIGIKKNLLYSDADMAQGALDTWADDHNMYWTGQNRMMPRVDCDTVCGITEEKTPLYN